MNKALADQVVAAVLYEGYILYPYRASAKKNRQRFTFGRVYPEAYSRAERGAEPCAMQTECLVRDDAARLTVDARFLQPMWREVLCNGVVVPEMEVDGRLVQSWQEAVERNVHLEIGEIAEVAHLAGGTMTHQFAFPFSEGTDAEMAPGVAIRRRREGIAGSLEVAAMKVEKGLWKVRVRVVNLTEVPENRLRDADSVLMRTFASTHAVLSVSEGEFISLLEPADEYAAAAAACHNMGVWPVLVGDEAKRERDTMLASPIILYDYPKIAPESAGDLCDGGEIDEILTLRIMTMTDAEKAEMRAVDDVARRILERTEAMPEEQLLKMHGSVREVRPVDTSFFNPESKPEGVTVRGVFLKVGDHVRIRPKRRADAMDIILAGKDAIIEAVEQDVEGEVHFALVMEDDPGKEIGFARMPGHRFFYTSEEVEPLEAQS